MSVTYDRGAADYDRFTGRWSRLYAPALLAAARVRAGDRVLDVASGTGEAAVVAAGLVGASGRVVATDISLPMLRVAGRKAAVLLLGMDGRALGFRDASFDAVVCQLGLMFFPDPLRALAEWRRVVRPDGRVALNVWSTPDRVPFFGPLVEALLRRLPAERETLCLPSALADPRRLARLLPEAGFDEVVVSLESRELSFESFDEYWTPIEAGAARLGQVYRGLSPEARRAVRAEVRADLSRFESPGRLVLPGEAWVGVGRRPP